MRLLRRRLAGVPGGLSGPVMSRENARLPGTGAGQVTIAEAVDAGDDRDDWPPRPFQDDDVPGALDPLPVASHFHLSRAEQRVQDARGAREAPLMTAWHINTGIHPDDRLDAVSEDQADRELIAADLASIVED